MDDQQDQGVVPAMVEVLTDDVLRMAGLSPVKAFVRTEGVRSGNAQRQQRKRQRLEDKGLRPLSLVAPADEAARDALRAVAEFLCGGGLTPSAVWAFANGLEPAATAQPTEGPQISMPVQLPPVPPEVERLNQVLAAGGLRARAIRLLLRT